MVVGVRVCVAVGDAVRVAVGSGVAVGVEVGVAVGMSVSVGVCVDVGVDVGSANTITGAGIGVGSLPFSIIFREKMAPIIMAAVARIPI